MSPLCMIMEKYAYTWAQNIAGHLGDIVKGNVFLFLFLFGLFVFS